MLFIFVSYKSFIKKKFRLIYALYYISNRFCHQQFNIFVLDVQGMDLLKIINCYRTQSLCNST